MSYFENVWEGYTKWWSYNVGCFEKGEPGSILKGIASSILAFVPGLPLAIVVSVLGGLVDIFCGRCLQSDYTAMHPVGSERRGSHTETTYVL